jgi:hypothetical protein
VAADELGIAQPTLSDQIRKLINQHMRMLHREYESA